MIGVADNGQLAPIPSSLRRAQHRYRRSSTGTGVAADAPSNWSARYSYLLTAVAGNARLASCPPGARLRFCATPGPDRSKTSKSQRLN